MIILGNGQHLLVRMPCCGGDLGCGVGGDGDMVSRLAIISVHRDISTLLLGVGAHSQQWMMGVPGGVDMDVARAGAGVDGTIKIQRHNVLLLWNVE